MRHLVTLNIRFYEKSTLFNRNVEIAIYSVKSALENILYYFTKLKFH
jgi:hypothetical protein